MCSKKRKKGLSESDFVILKVTGTSGVSFFGVGGVNTSVNVTQFIKLFKQIWLAMSLKICNINQLA